MAQRPKAGKVNKAPKHPKMVLVRWLDADLSTSDEGKSRHIIEEARPTYLETIGYAIGVSEIKGEQFIHLSFDFDVSDPTKLVDEGWFRSHQKIPLSLVREIHEIARGKRLWRQK